MVGSVQEVVDVSTLCSATRRILQDGVDEPESV